MFRVFTMTQKMLTTSLLVVCLATTSLISNHAIAKDPDQYFYPKSKWNIEKINDKTCAISNYLNNGYKIQLAGTKDGFTNLNIDFRQKSFKANNNYEVKYSIPGAIEKTISAKAFKENLLVTDLRGENDFSSALNKSSVLDVKIKNTEFRIYMTGLAAKMDEYNGCIDPEAARIAKIKVPKQPKIIQSDNNLLAPPPPLDIEEYAQEGDIAVSQVNKKMPSNKLRPTPSTERYTEKLAQRMKEESAKYKPDENKESSELEKISTKPEENVIEIIEIDIATEPKATLAAAKTEEKHVSREHIKSTKAVYNVTKMKPMTVDLTNMPESNHTPDINKGDQKLSEINSTGGGNIDNDELVNMRNKIANLEKQVSRLSKKNIMLDEELKAALQDAEDERLSVSSDNWNLERATMKFNEAERQIMRLGRQLQSQKAKCQQEKNELENMLFDPKLTNQQQLANLATLEAELDKVKADMYRQQRQYEERIRILEQQLNAR